MHRSEFKSNLIFLFTIFLASFIVCAQDDVPRRDFPISDVPGHVQTVLDVVYATAKTDDGDTIELLMDTAFPRGSETLLPVALFIHGGGYVSGARRDGHRPSVMLASGGYFAATIDYRLAGQAIFPAAVHDCKAAVRFIRSHADELGIDPNRIGVWGYSAGGHLASLIGASGNETVLDGEIGQTNVHSDVACVATVAGPVDFLSFKKLPPGMQPLADPFADDSYLSQWLGGPVLKREAMAKQASVLTYIDKADPPFLIIHGLQDRLVPITQAKVLAEALDQNEVEVDFQKVPSAGHRINPNDWLPAVAEFFDEHLGGEAMQVIQEFQARDKQRPGKTNPAPLPTTPASNSKKR